MRRRREPCFQGLSPHGSFVMITRTVVRFCCSKGRSWNSSAIGLGFRLVSFSFMPGLGELIEGV